jgi:hypothetical protein
VHWLLFRIRKYDVGQLKLLSFGALDTSTYEIIHDTFYTKVNAM